MVRLKVFDKTKAAFELTVFQFLDGAIKRDYWKDVKRFAELFQFLDGAIKRR